jgi:hypothetical protein
MHDNIDAFPETCAKPFVRWCFEFSSGSTFLKNSPVLLIIRDPSTEYRAPVHSIDCMLAKFSIDQGPTVLIFKIICDRRCMSRDETLRATTVEIYSCPC